MSKIDHLIICNPYEMPSQHWKYDRTERKFDLIAGRRPAGIFNATPNSKSFDDPGVFCELPLVNRIRERVDAWKQNGYPGATGTTKKLLEFWHHNEQRESRLFFCQLEAVETLIWLTEAPHSERQGIDVPSDGGSFARWCCKMATGTGKTIVIAMVIAWQAINKSVRRQDSRFSRNILVMAPGLTVKSRLQVLHPTRKGNIYDEFDLVPDSLRENLFHARIAIHNWHTLEPKDDAPRSVVKLGRESDSAFAKRILGHNLDNIVVINDEAHHAYRADKDQPSSLSKEEQERDKLWMEGLDKIHAARGITHCFDFSATPFKPSGKNIARDDVFKWVVSDFSLNDAIESGLTKTPRISIQDDGDKFDDDYRSRFYHIYMDDEVKPDLNRNAKPYEKLPDLVANAYMLLGQDWIETKKIWEENESPIPPVMITVCNKTNTAARVMHSFEKNQFELDDLSDPEHILRIDSAMIKKAEEQDSVGSSREEKLRERVSTVGKHGKPGEQIRNIIAVQMLSEGWDAKNVTHIMGLRAFSSQLLCEQVVGRGLRRMSYEIDEKTGLYLPEYVNVFGIPFTFLPHEKPWPPPPPPPPPPIIEARMQHVISWPNIDRIDTNYKPILSVDWNKITVLKIGKERPILTVGMAQILAGKPDPDKMSEIDLHELNKEIRLQRIIFVTAKDVYEKMSPNWKGNKEFLIAQVVRIVEEFIGSGKIDVINTAEGDALRRKMTILFNMNKVVNHVWDSITSQNASRKRISLNAIKPVKSTFDMRAWHTKKPTHHAAKSHTRLAPHDSGWELAAMQEFDDNESVMSWAKNDHIGFVIKYLYNGVVRDYFPDFLIRLSNRITLVLEIKGVDTEQNRTKRRYLKEWTDAVNDDGRYGAWAWDVAFHPSEVQGIIAKHVKSKISAREQAKCPRCGKTADSRQEIDKKFGFRNVDGIIRPQSWCKPCRKIHAKTA